NSPDVPVYFAALSPDGRYLAYIDPRGTFLREIGTDESHALPLPEGFRVHHLSWYPDGTHLLAEAVAGQEQRPSLWNISVLGGAARKLVAGAEAGSVSPDGKQVAFLRGDKFDHSEIWLADTDGGGPQVAVEVPGFVVGPPAWSPDSRRFAYLQDVYRADRTGSRSPICPPTESTPCSFARILSRRFTWPMCMLKRARSAGWSG